MSYSVLDASPMLAYLRAEPGGEVVRTLIEDTDVVCFAHAVNVIEVFYDFLRHRGELVAQEALKTLSDDGVIFREDMDREFWESVGRLKARGRISLADCFCIALAQRVGGEVVTADHHEMDALVPMGLCGFRFIR